MDIKLVKILNNADCKNILIIGVVHGDEPQGEILINKFLSENKNSRQKNNLYFITRLNPTNSRKNQNGVDINRNFPTKNWVLGDKNDDYFGGYKSGSEKETQFVVNLMNEVKFDVILTIHSPYKVVNYDGPAKDLALEIAQILDYPTEDYIGYPTPGSFGTYSGIERQIPTLTVELDENAGVDEIYPKMKKVFEYLGEI